MPSITFRGTTTMWTRTPLPASSSMTRASANPPYPRTSCIASRAAAAVRKSPGFNVPTPGSATGPGQTLAETGSTATSTPTTIWFSNALRSGGGASTGAAVASGGTGGGVRIVRSGSSSARTTPGAPNATASVSMSHAIRRQTHFIGGAY